MAVHYSSATPEWETPQKLFAALDAEFGFTLDVCATPENAKCPHFITKDQNALRLSWIT
jgi:site-specific DNA-methyltransferase (adenine-specific)